MYTQTHKQQKSHFLKVCLHKQPFKKHTYTWSPLHYHTSIITNINIFKRLFPKIILFGCQAINSGILFSQRMTSDCKQAFRLVISPFFLHSSRVQFLCRQQGLWVNNQTLSSLHIQMGYRQAQPSSS